MNTIDTKLLLNLSYKLDKLTNKLNQLKLSEKVFLVDKDEYSVKINNIEEEIKFLIVEISKIVGDFK